MQTISTKTTASGKVKAYQTCFPRNAGITEALDDSRDAQDGHALVAMKLAKALCWSGSFVSGSTEEGYIFVFANDRKYEV